MSIIWQSGANHPKFDKLSGERRTEVLVVGGGMAGILITKFLSDAGVDCILAEAGEICGGVTKNTTAKLSAAHGLIYSRLIGRYGEEYARRYLEANLEALGKFSELCQKIDCDYEVRDSYVYSLSDVEKIKSEVSALNTLGVPAELSTTDELPITTVGAVRLRNQAQLHPLKFAYAIANGLPIFENTKVRHIMPHRAVTDGGDIAFDKIIIATHFPIVNKHGGYFIKMYQHRSYVLALRGAGDISGMYIDQSGTGLSFRQYWDMLLLGGGSHRTGKRGGGWRELEEFAAKHYPNAEIVERFATQDCMTLDGVPYIGKYSTATPDMYVATGFNKWGMTSSMVSAMLLSDMILGKKNRYERVFSPSRSILHPTLAKNALEAVVNLLTPTAPRCPHLGCALKYNAAEHSWDCPCHGSRFTDSGELIDGPATDDKRL